jgi:hypothetical protein
MPKSDDDLPISPQTGVFEKSWGKEIDSDIANEIQNSSPPADHPDDEKE